jgi:integrase
MGSALRGQRTLKRVLDAYLDRMRIHSKPGSLRTASSSCKNLLTHFGKCSVYDLGPQDLDGFILHRREGGVTDKTINGDLIVLRAAFNYAAEIGLLQDVPFKIKLLKVRRRKSRKILERDDLKKLLDRAGDRMNGRIYGILMVAIHTGFRTDEILHLQWRDVGWEDGSLHITTKPGIWSSKSHQERTVFVSPELTEWLSQHRTKTTHPGDRDWIFATRTGTPTSLWNTCRAVRKVFEEAGLYEKGEATIHLIRHSVASTLLSNGTDLETVRDWLGHADISTTGIYLSTTDKRRREAASKLSLIGGN